MPGRPPLPGFAADLDPYVIEVNFEAIPDPKRGKEFLPNFKEFMESLKTP